MVRVHNFNAGPGALPLPVLLQIQEELVDFRGQGMSLLEMSHRGGIYEELHNQCVADIKTLLGADDEWQVIFMGGGARTQFAYVPLNHLPRHGFAEYHITGTWAQGAWEEAKKLGDARATWSSKDSNFDHVPRSREVSVDSAAAYVHYTSNNTIYGTQYHELPDTGAVPLFCDMSSDIMSRPVDLDRYTLIYAGAQKNMGPAGVTVVLARRGLLERVSDTLPLLMSHKAVAKENSLLNTPPVFAIYAVGLVMKWLIAQGGLPGMEAANRKKAWMVYDAIDRSGGFYKGHARDGSRSWMNLTWRLPTEDLEKRFAKEADAAGLIGLKGHRSVGGIRASLYNAVPESSAAVLVQFMDAFKAKAG